MNHQKIIDTANHCLQIKYKINEYYALVGRRINGFNDEAKAVIYEQIEDLEVKLKKAEEELKKLTA